MERRPHGVVEPIPTLPDCVTRRSVRAEEPTTNVGLAPRPVESTENCAHGVEEPTPILPFWLTPPIKKAGEVLPELETTNTGLRVPISMESLPHGVDVPMPTSPTGELRVEMLKVGWFAVDVPILKTLSTPFCTLKVKLPALLTFMNVVVAELPVVDAIVKRLSAREVEAAKIDRSADGEVVPPIPTLPPLSIMKYVCDDEPTTNAGTPAPRPFGFIERRPQGVVVPMPMLPDCETRKSVRDDEPTTNDGFPISENAVSTDSLPQGVVVPNPELLFAVTMNEVLVDEPMTNAGTVPPSPFGFTES